MLHERRTNRSMGWLVRKGRQSLRPEALKALRHRPRRCGGMPKGVSHTTGLIGRRRTGSPQAAPFPIFCPIFWPFRRRTKVLGKSFEPSRPASLLPAQAERPARQAVTHAKKFAIQAPDALHPPDLEKATSGACPEIRSPG